MKKIVNGIEVSCTPEEVAARQAEEQAWADGAAARQAEADRLATDATEQTAVKASSQVQAFLNFTPTQLDNWIDTNIGAAATLTAVRAACVIAFKVLGRIALAAGRGRTLR